LARGTSRLFERGLKNYILLLNIYIYIYIYIYTYIHIYIYIYACMCACIYHREMIISARFVRAAIIYESGIRANRNQRRGSVPRSHGFPPPPPLSLRKINNPFLKRGRARLGVKGNLPKTIAKSYPRWSNGTFIEEA
jgi:hypothetical protein